MADYSDLDRQIEQLKRCEIIRETEVKALCAKAREILVEEGNVQRVDSPVTVRSCLPFCMFLLFSIEFFFERNEKNIYKSYAWFINSMFICVFYCTGVR